MKKLQIAIDGVAGSGKSSIAKEIAKTTDFKYVNSGAFYRASAMRCLEKGIDLTDEHSVAKAVRKFKITINYIDGLQHTYIDGEDYTKKTLLAEAGDAASKLAVIKPIRKIMIKLSRKVAKNFNCVMEGRDIGSVVFPKAKLKFFFTAAPEVRAERRLKQLRENGDNETTYEETLQLIKERDFRDINRSYLPLKVVKDAIVVDTSKHNQAEVLNIVKSYIDKIK